MVHFVDAGEGALAESVGRQGAATSRPGEEDEARWGEVSAHGRGEATTDRSI